MNAIIQDEPWPMQEAKKLLSAVQKKASRKDYVLFETGYGPSGLPHVGTFAEVFRTMLIIKAWNKISSIPAKLICFSDDMDALRKVPENLPNQEMLKANLGRPLSAIPDPFGEKSSYAEYMNDKLCNFLNYFHFDYDFYSATEQYKSGNFNHMMIRVIEKYDDIMNIMLPTLREERRKTYSPFMPICPHSGKVLQVKIEKVNKDNNSVSYLNEENNMVEVSVLNGNCKLQWKPDFGMRWAALDVDYEMYGKDHETNSEIYSKICETLGNPRPVQFFYEMFLDENGSKVSKSKGSDMNINNYLKYAPLEVLSLFIYKSPEKAKKLCFSVIVRTIDEYMKLNQEYHANKSENHILHYIHSDSIPNIDTKGVSFTMILNLVSVCDTSSKEVLWSFMNKYLKHDTLNDDTKQFLDKLLSCAMNYYKDFVQDTKDYGTLTEDNKDILHQLLEILLSIKGQDISAEELQNKIYAIGRENTKYALNDFFAIIYKLLLGQKFGPRLGSFFKLLGIDESVHLIQKSLSRT